MATLHLTGVVLLLATGCASTLPPREQRLVDDCEALMDALEERKQRAVTHRQRDGAKALGKAICQLTERICVIAKRNPRSGGARESCRDARARCKDATVLPAVEPGG